MVQKVPPPPALAKEQQSLNRWLIELASILNSDGEIDPSQVAGLPALIVQVAANTAAVAANAAAIGQANVSIGNLQTSVAQNTSDINALTVALAARSQVFNAAGAPLGIFGSVGDWYADTTGLHIYVKTAAAVWTLIV